MNSLKNLSAKISRINSRGIGEVLDKNEFPIFCVPFSLPGEVANYFSDGSNNIKELKFNIDLPDDMQLLKKSFENFK